MTVINTEVLPEKFTIQRFSIEICTIETKPNHNPNTNPNPNPTKAYHLTVLFKVYRDHAKSDECYNAFKWCP